MAGNVASQGARGGVVTILGQIIKMGIQVVSVTILSRLLDPGDFGLIAMTSVFVALGSLFRDFGMPTAALQARSLSNQQASNLFWVNASMGVLAAAALMLSSPWIISFYDESRLRGLLPIMALSIVIGGLTAQYQIQLARNLKFTTLTVSNIASQLAGLMIAVLGAVLGFGFWALAWQVVASSLSLFLIQALAAKWIPNLPRIGAGTRQILKSGVSFGGSHLLTYGSQQIDTLVIGSRWGATEVGEYNRAFQLLSMPVQSMMSPLTNVVIPTINKARDQGKSVDSLLLKIQSLVGGATVWVFLIAAVTADFTVPLLLGPGWESSILLFKILAIGGMFHVFSFVSYWGFMLYNQSDQLLRYNLLTKTMTIVAIVVASFFSVEAIAWAYSLTLLVSWPINLVWLRLTTPQDSWAYFRNGGRILVAAAVAGATGLIVYEAIESSLSAFIAAVVVGLAGTLVFLLTILVLPGGRKVFAAAREIVPLIVGRGGTGSKNGR